jgi:hypothetical protein
MNSVPHRIARMAPSLIAAVLLAICVATPVLADNKGLVCGAPKKNGGLSVYVRVTDAAGNPHIIEHRIDWLINVDAEGKAEIIRGILNDTYAIPTRDTLHCGGTGTEVLPTGANGWTFRAIWIGRDSTYEDDKVLSSATPTGDWALCSLDGVASGLSPSGGPGYVRVRAFGGTAMVPTSPGMPAQFIEQLIGQQLIGQGVLVRPAQPSDFAGDLAALPHDPSVLYIAPGASGAPSDTALAPEVNDAGLILDLAGVAYPPAGTTGVVAPRGVPGLRLELAPNVFGDGGIRIAYATGAARGPIRVSVLDVSGRQVRSLVERGEAPSGALRWDARDDHGADVPSGVYFVRIVVPGGSMVRAAVRVR